MRLWMMLRFQVFQVLGGTLNKVPMSGCVSVHKKGSVKLGLTLGGIDAGFPYARK